MTTPDEWVTAALADDALVVELLFRLKQSSESLPLPPPILVPPVGWGHRQPRSKHVVSAAAATRKERESTRCSPTTPLSWSCGGSASPSDGCDESSRPSDPSSGGRSKGVFSNETTATATTTNKRSRKKTFSELKEEESLLLKERVQLKKELANLRVTYKGQKVRSGILKRIKLDLSLQSANKMAATSDEMEAANSGRHILAGAYSVDHNPDFPTITMQADLPAVASCKVEKEVETREPASCKVEKEVETGEQCFVLPDLNMMPSEEDFGGETSYQLS